MKICIGTLRYLPFICDFERLPAWFATRLTLHLPFCPSITLILGALLSESWTPGPSAYLCCGVC